MCAQAQGRQADDETRRGCASTFLSCVFGSSTETTRHQQEVRSAGVEEARLRFSDEPEVMVIRQGSNRDHVDFTLLLVIPYPDICILAALIALLTLLSLSTGRVVDLSVRRLTTKHRE